MDKIINIKKEFSCRVARISLSDDNIIRVVFHKNARVEIADQRELFILFQEITAGRKHPFIFDAAPNVKISAESKEYSAKMESLQPISAVAVVARNLGYKIISKLYFLMHKSRIPHKVFSNDRKAAIWLQQFVSTI